jgi:hypothetical protein
MKPGLKTWRGAYYSITKFLLTIFDIMLKLILVGIGLPLTGEPIPTLFTIRGKII